MSRLGGGTVSSRWCWWHKHKYILIYLPLCERGYMNWYVGWKNRWWTWELLKVKPRAATGVFFPLYLVKWYKRDIIHEWTFVLLSLLSFLFKEEKRKKCKCTNFSQRLICIGSPPLKLVRDEVVFSNVCSSCFTCTLDRMISVFLWFGF